MATAQFSHCLHTSIPGKSLHYFFLCFLKTFFFFLISWASEFLQVPGFQTRREFHLPHDFHRGILLELELLLLLVRLYVSWNLNIFVYNHGERGAKLWGNGHRNFILHSVIVTPLYVKSFG